MARGKFNGKNWGKSLGVLVYLVVKEYVNQFKSKNGRWPSEKEFFSVFHRGMTNHSVVIPKTNCMIIDKDRYDLFKSIDPTARMVTNFNPAWYFFLFDGATDKEYYLSNQWGNSYGEVDQIADYARTNLNCMIDIEYDRARNQTNNDQPATSRKSQISKEEISLNTILYGPPGTGKTYSTINYAVAILLNESIAVVNDARANEENDKKIQYRSESKTVKEWYKDGIDNGRIEFITFHQSYGYEDFIVGIRPQLNGGSGIDYERYEGVFKRFCDKARNDPKNRYVFIIDEINRGNISKIFGELITLIEKDKRDDNNYAIELPYSKGEAKFTVPQNVYLLGTMNTADRSIALLDTALRRRFDFVEMMPKYNTLEEDCDGVDLQKLLEKMNRRIEVLFDREHMVGHAYLFSVRNIDDLKQVFQKKIIPLLQEYFFEDYEKIALILNDGCDFSQKNKEFLFFRMINDKKLFSPIPNGDYNYFSASPKYELNSDAAWDNPSLYIKIYDENGAAKNYSDQNPQNSQDGDSVNVVDNQITVQNGAEKNEPA